MAPHSVDGVSGCHDPAFSGDSIWNSIRRDAQEMANEQAGLLDAIASDLLPGILESSILKWSSLEEALAAHLASKLSFVAAPADRWQRILSIAFTRGVSTRGDHVTDLIRKDLTAIKERDPACPSLGHAFLYFKGFHGLQVYRAANWLWRNGQQSLASVLQSRVSEVFAMDIHPAAQIGWGIMIDHATGIVIGETAVVGNGCTMLHGVTFGGTGKQHGDRHPKLGTNVLVGAGASILGNVKIGDGAKIGAAALVLHDIPPGATAVGCPAKVIGRTKEENPASVLDQTFNLVEVFTKKSKCLCPYRHLNAAKEGFVGPNDFANRLKDVFGAEMSRNEMMALFFKLDTDNDGQLTETEFDNIIGVLTSNDMVA